MNKSVLEKSQRVIWRGKGRGWEFKALGMKVEVEEEVKEEEKKRKLDSHLSVFHETAFNVTRVRPYSSYSWHVTPCNRKKDAAGCFCVFRYHWINSHPTSSSTTGSCIDSSVILHGLLRQLTISSHVHEDKLLLYLCSLSLSFSSYIPYSQKASLFISSTIITWLY